MKTTVEYLDHVKKTQGITSDYALAKVLNTNRHRVSALRKGKVHLNTTECLRISLAGKLDLREVIAAIGLERGDETVREEWKSYAKKFLGQGLACVGGLMISTSELLHESLAGLLKQCVLC
jgi:hypothetical protein